MVLILVLPMTNEFVAEAQLERQLNDKLRREMPHGSVIIRGGVKQFSNEQLVALTALIQDYDEFEPRLGTGDLHDSGTLMFEGVEVVWRIEKVAAKVALQLSDDVAHRVERRILVIFKACELKCPTRWHNITNFAD